MLLEMVLKKILKCLVYFYCVEFVSMIFLQRLAFNFVFNKLAFNFVFNKFISSTRKKKKKLASFKKNLKCQCIKNTDQIAQNFKKNCFVVVVSNEMVKSNLHIFSKFFANNKSNFARKQCCVLHATKNVSLINYRTYFLLLF